MNESSESWEILETICAVSNWLSNMVKSQSQKSVTQLFILHFSIMGSLTWSEYFEGISLSKFVLKKNCKYLLMLIGKNSLT